MKLNHDVTMWLFARPTLEVAQADNLKLKVTDTRPGEVVEYQVWLSRLTVADGATHDLDVTVERRRPGHADTSNWVTGGRIDLVGALLATGDDEAVRLSKNI